MKNFGKIKNTFNNLLAEGILKKNPIGKELFKKYIKIIKESDILKTQFFIYDNLENKVDSDPISVNIFISENVKLLDDINREDIVKENEKLVSLLSDITIEDNYEGNTLHEAISNVIFFKKTPATIDKFSNEVKNIANHIINNKIESNNISEGINMPISFLTNLMVDKYNTKYDSLDETDKKVLKLLMNSTFDDKKTFYSKTVQECMSMVEILLVESDSETKQKLYKVKEKLLVENKFSEDDFLTEISKLIDLKESLKTE